MENDKKIRLRGENWTQDEKEVLLKIMKKSGIIIENKNTDTNTNKKKSAEWQRVRNQFIELTGQTRELTQLKGFWRRLKITAKKNLAAHKRAINSKGSGRKPPSPLLDDEKVMEVGPVDFVDEQNILDSDGILLDENDSTMASDKNKKKESVIYDCEILENSIEEEDEATEKPNIITIAGLHDIEVTTHEDESDLKTPKTSKAKQTPKREKNVRAETSHKGAIADMNIELKRMTMDLLKKEFALKIQFHKQELENQYARQELEMKILNEKLQLLQLQKEKAELEIKELKKKQ